MGFVDMLIAIVVFIFQSRSLCDLEITFSDFIKIEPNQLGYGDLLICQCNGGLYCPIKVTEKQLCDLKMTFSKFIEIEPNRLGYANCDKWFPILYQDPRKITV